ncbi:hypothetical protein ILUMI_14485, partial [Ignelater luminosus]
EYPKSASYEHVIRRRGAGQKVCRQVSLFLLAITESRLESLQKHLPENNGTPPVDLRGKHYNRPNQISDNTDLKKAAGEHILSFPKYVLL